MSLFKTRRVRGARVVPERHAATFDNFDAEPGAASVEGVTLDHFVAFVAMVGQPSILAADHEAIAQQIGFPAGRYDLIRSLWMTRIYSTPALAREFGERLDLARKRLV
jgi:hypothetical protein